MTARQNQSKTLPAESRAAAKSLNIKLLQHLPSGRVGRGGGRSGVLQVSSAPPRPFKRPTLPREGKNELHDLQGRWITYRAWTKSQK